MIPEDVQRLKDLEAKVDEGSWEERVAFIIETRNALPNLLADWERMHQALDAVLSYAGNTNEGHVDHIQVVAPTKAGEGCLLCVIEELAQYGLSAE